MDLRLSELRGDERAIEGLPVRLVVAFVVGVACLSVMLNLVSGVNTLAASELGAQPTPDVVHPGSRELDVRAVDANGDPVAGVTVVLKPGTARLDDGIAVAKTNENGVASLDVTPRLRANQQEGTLDVTLKPPSGSYTDNRQNTGVLVVEG
ncbi:DUF7382 domain-containing protein [Halocalculus aciditolerans]|uniref:DUF7382 domain-containing protein n=1 Tax=Halocalculus aciditolerans TaxID=1383812 RepID=A0A830FLX0_9EURY|nr:carboxypeptidase regulatory-like domain-containing protein [Halocalculus aciditolerans]GGL68696.1 hypothetical protein GCM10009039_28370 [Halocalculus aciditolerans]